MKKLKMAKVVETKDGIYINHHLIPFICCKEDGSSMTKIEPFGEYTNVTITFVARSYLVNYKRRYKQYEFKKPSILRRLFS